MNILALKREEVQFFIGTGVMRPENLRHFDICKALASGMTQEKIAEKFNLTDDSHVRYVKNRKCPDCYKVL